MMLSLVYVMKICRHVGQKINHIRYGNRLILTPIHTIRLTGKVNSKGLSQDILNTLSK